VPVCQMLMDESQLDLIADDGAQCVDAHPTRADSRGKSADINAANEGDRAEIEVDGQWGLVGNVVIENGNAVRENHGAGWGETSDAPSTIDHAASEIGKRARESDSMEGEVVDQQGPEGDAAGGVRDAAGVNDSRASEDRRRAAGMIGHMVSEVGTLIDRAEIEGDGQRELVGSAVTENGNRPRANHDMVSISGGAMTEVGSQQVLNGHGECETDDGMRSIKAGEDYAGLTA
ncbi:unnamed protein product, partial [Prorocentrum cordatum]